MKFLFSKCLLLSSLITLCNSGNSTQCYNIDCLSPCKNLNDTQYSIVEQSNLSCETSSKTCLSQNNTQCSYSELNSLSFNKLDKLGSFSSSRKETSSTINSETQINTDLNTTNADITEFSNKIIDTIGNNEVNNTNVEKECNNDKLNDIKCNNINIKTEIDISSISSNTKDNNINKQNKFDTSDIKININNNNNEQNVNNINELKNENINEKYYSIDLYDINNSYEWNTWNAKDSYGSELLMNNITEEELNEYKTLKIWINNEQKITDEILVDKLSSYLTLCSKDLIKSMKKMKSNKIDNNKLSNIDTNNRNEQISRTLCWILENIINVVVMLPNIPLYMTDGNVMNQYVRNIGKHYYSCKYLSNIPEFELRRYAINYYSAVDIATFIGTQRNIPFIRAYLDRLTYYLSFYNNMSVKDIINGNANYKINNTKMHPWVLLEPIKGAKPSMNTYSLKYKRKKNDDSLCSIF